MATLRVRLSGLVAAAALAGCFSDPDPTEGSGGSSTAGTETESTTLSTTATSNDATGTTTGGSGPTSAGSQTTGEVGSSSSTGSVPSWEPTQTWIEIVDGASQGDRGDALVVADATTVWAVGSVGAAGGTDMWAALFSVADGSVVQTSVIDDGGTTTQSRGVAMTDDGGLFIVGHGTELGTDRFIATYDPTAMTFGDLGIPPSPDYDIAHDVAVADPYTFVVGVVSDAPDDRQAWLARYSGATLDLEWTFGEAGVSDEANAIVADSDQQNFVIVGAMSNVAGDRDGWIQRMSRNGQVRWTAAFVDGEGTDQVAYDVTRNAAGEYLVTGTSEVPGENLNVWVQSYGRQSGSLGPQALFGGIGDEIGRGIAVGPDDSVYVCGGVTDATEGRNIWLAKFSPTLDLIGFVSRDGGAGENDLALDCVIVDDHLIVTGQLRRNAGNDELFVAAYTL